MNLLLNTMEMGKTPLKKLQTELDYIYLNSMKILMAVKNNLQGGDNF